MLEAQFMVTAQKDWRGKPLFCMTEVLDKAHHSFDKSSMLWVVGHMVSVTARFEKIQKPL